ncbi:bcl-2-related ovarian killer protein homolog B-like, partial [Anopheles cruzii]|uniref:bcl-2-related ovarian killer protein homolog B-like n=1 Tax=Anopheles cruzii TaxID=68878 RepID=UPI0022EC43B0
MERIYPWIYTGIARQLRMQGTAPMLLSAITRDLFKLDIPLGKVAITGGFSADCIRQGHPEYLPKLLEGLANVIEDEPVAWISEEKITFTGRCLVWACCVMGLFIVVFLLKTF